MTAPAREIALALAGRRAQRLADGSYLTRCPLSSHGKGRGDLNPSLRIGDGQTRLLVHCYAGCDPCDVLDALRRRGLLEHPTKPMSRSHGATSTRAEKDRTAGAAAAIWRESVDAHGTPVELYLASRQLVLPPSADVLRYHAACPFGKTRTPAMVALLRNIESDKAQAIHRTALGEIDGAHKMSLGPTAGGAIKLTPDENVTIALGVAEGIETHSACSACPSGRARRCGR
jgi:putative DNA primase/helicase